MPGEPVCSVIVFCDLHHYRTYHGKKLLNGTFRTLQAPQFPSWFRRFFVHVSIANIVPIEKPVSIVLNLQQTASGAVLEA